MLWSDFYDGFWDWSDSTRRTRISSLEDMGSGEEIVEVIYEIEDPKVRSQLIRKAMKMGATFTSEDFMNLDGELTDELYEELGKYAGFDHNDPYFDEDNMEWDDFYGCYSDWSDDVLLRRIRKLKKYGPSEEVADAIQCMPTSEAEDLLYKKAVAAGVRFTDEEMLAMGNLVDVLIKSINTLSSDLDSKPVARSAPAHKATTQERMYMGSPDQVVDIQVLDIEDHGSNVMVCYTQIFGDGNRKSCRRNVKDLGGYYNFLSPKPIVSAVCLGKVYCGIIKSDVRVLFVVKLTNGTAQIIQTREGSKETLKLLQLSEDTASGYVQPPPPPPPKTSSKSVQPYQLNKNELPQGSYLIGRDIPAGTYDFFVVYGTGGKFDIGKYDANDKVINGTWDFFWVGLKEDYEKRELVHIQCKEGYTVKISGNVVLKIARSQKVRIDL